MPQRQPNKAMRSCFICTQMSPSRSPLAVYFISVTATTSATTTMTNITTMRTRTNPPRRTSCVETYGSTKGVLNKFDIHLNRNVTSHHFHGQQDNEEHSPGALNRSTTLFIFTEVVTNALCNCVGSRVDCTYAPCLSCDLLAGHGSSLEDKVDGTPANMGRLIPIY